MPLTPPPASVNDAFFQPRCGLAAASQHTRSCPGFPDADFLQPGVQRVLEPSTSRRAFLQEHGVRRDTHRVLLPPVLAPLHDRLAGIPELAGYVIFATDGHWHQAAPQDARRDGRKMAAAVHPRSRCVSHRRAPPQGLPGAGKPGRCSRVRLIPETEPLVVRTQNPQVSSPSFAVMST